MPLRWRLSVCIALSALISLAAQAPPPVLNYTSPPNFLKLFGPVGTGTFTPSPHFYIFAPDGRVYRTFDVLNVPQSDPSRFDFATAARIDPDDSGQFAVQGGFLIMRFGGAQPESLRVPLSPNGSSS